MVLSHDFPYPPLVSHCNGDIKLRRPSELHTDSLHLECGQKWHGRAARTLKKTHAVVGYIRSNNNNDDDDDNNSNVIFHGNIMGIQQRIYT